jgi:hypothetical protein
LPHKSIEVSWYFELLSNAAKKMEVHEARALFKELAPSREEFVDDLGFI